MQNHPILDFHTHAFPDALAPRAMAQLTENAASSGYSPLTDGTLQGLHASMDRGGITYSVVCHIATNPHQMRKVNDFAISCKEDSRLIPLGSVHPGAALDELLPELDRIWEAGLPGLKLHPDYMGEELDSPAFTPLLKGCEERGLLVVTHAGLDPVSPHHVHCTPDMILHVLDRHPSLKLVAAHMGGFDREEEVLEKLCGAPLWLDTSLCAVRMKKSRAWGELCIRILSDHDPSRLLFATDTPWSDPAAELSFLRQLPLSETQLKGILWGNAQALLSSCGWLL